MIKVTPHPPWVIDLLDFLTPFKERIVNSEIFRDIDSGLLTLEQFQFGLVNFYPLIENFPKYMALNLAKVPSGDSNRNRKTRYWLITNINQERRHATWWKRWAVGFGVRSEVFDVEIYPPPEMDAINNYLWRVCTQGSLAEGISAANFAIEGPTGEWTKAVKASIEKNYYARGLNGSPKTLEWVTAHASYDDRHPEEALEIVKAYASTRIEQDRVKRSAKRSMEYYAVALEACYGLMK